MALCDWSSDVCSSDLSSPIVVSISREYPMFVASICVDKCYILLDHLFLPSSMWTSTISCLTSKQHLPGDHRDDSSDSNNSTITCIAFFMLEAIVVQVTKYARYRLRMSSPSELHFMDEARLCCHADLPDVCPAAISATSSVETTMLVERRAHTATAAKVIFAVTNQPIRRVIQPSILVIIPCPRQIKDSSSAPTFIRTTGSMIRSRYPSCPANHVPRLSAIVVHFPTRRTSQSSVHVNELGTSCRIGIQGCLETMSTATVYM